MVRNFYKRCVIVGAAPADESDINHIKSKINGEDFIISADGGLDNLKKAGIEPNLLIGDFDSCKTCVDFDIEIIKLPIKKDDTDMLYSIKEGIKRGFTDFLILCGTGGRLDHTIANISCIYYLSRQGFEGVLSDKCYDIFVVYKDSLVIKDKIGKTVSVFQYGEENSILSYDGLEYELKMRELKCSEPIGISNVIVSKYAKVTVHKGAALVIVFN